MRCSGSGSKVFEPPRSGPVRRRYGSEAIHHQAKIVRKPLVSSILWLFFDFLTVKNDVNVPSKSNKLKKIFVAILKVIDGKNGIRIL
jgi:hypothetical protein